MTDLLGDVEFADNPEPRCAVALVLDTSGSMAGAPIAELNQGIQDFAGAVKADGLAAARVEVAIVTFGGPPTIQDLRGGSGALPQVAVQDAFVGAATFVPPHLSARGDTPMGEAAQLALRLITERKSAYRVANIDYFRPWLVLITDGNPTDSGWEAKAAAIRDEESRKGVYVYPIGVLGANVRKLSQFSSVCAPLVLQGLNFKELFMWLSKSMISVSQSRIGDQVVLPEIGGWGKISS